MLAPSVVTASSQDPDEGVLAFVAQGTLTVDAASSISLVARGYGGGGRSYGALTVGEQGWGPLTPTRTHTPNGPSGGGGRAVSLTHASGGGGHGTSGGTGATVLGWGNTPGEGGSAVGDAAFSELWFGGGGGSGGLDADPGAGSYGAEGGRGGGIVLLAVGDLALEEMAPDAFCSALVDDCIHRRKTIKEGGAVYDVVSGLQSGVANVANALMAVKHTLFDEHTLTVEQIQTALSSNYDGIQGEKVRQILLSAPKYGNDVDEVDNIATRVLNDYLEIVKPYRNTRYGRGPVGCNYAGSTSNISSNVPLGQPVCATPDGRKAGEAIAEGVSNFHGTDTRGPTAVMRSVTKLPTIKMLAQLLNIRLSPSTLSTDAGLWQLVHLLRGFQTLKGWHVQFNVVDSKTLLAAQLNPEDYKDLIVRVAGYSALFVTLDKATQDDIIQRTEYVL